MHASSSLSVCIDTQIGLSPYFAGRRGRVVLCFESALGFCFEKDFSCAPVSFSESLFGGREKEERKENCKKYSLVSLFFFSCEQRGKRGLQVFFKHISHKSKIMTHMLNRMQLQSNQSLFRRKKEDPSRRNGSISFFYPKNTMRRTRKPLKKTWKTFTKSSKKTK